MEKNSQKEIIDLIYSQIVELNQIDFIETEEDVESDEDIEDKCDNCETEDAKQYYDFSNGSVLCDVCYKKIGKKWQKDIDEYEGEVESIKTKIITVNELVSSLELNLNKLKKSGMSEIKINEIKDLVAWAIREISIKIHNDTDGFEESINLLKIAIKVVYSNELKKSLEEDLKQIKANARDNDFDAYLLEIPGNSKNLIFKNQCLEYGKKKIFYKDIVEISFNAVNNSINFIPTTQKYNFYIASETEDIDFSFSSFMHIGGEKRKEAWTSLIGLYENLIEPILVERLVKKIFKKKEVVQIGKITFDKDGYHRSKFFGGIESTFWEDTLYSPKFSSGEVIVYNNDGGHFETISMEVSNAVVIPELIAHCKGYYDSMSKK